MFHVLWLVSQWQSAVNAIHLTYCNITSPDASRWNGPNESYCGMQKMASAVLNKSLNRNLFTVIFTHYFTAV